MEFNEQKFIDGFNSGYLLAEFEPQLLNSLLSNINPTNSYISGMIGGQKEFEQFLLKNHKDELTALRQKSKDNKELNL